MFTLLRTFLSAIINIMLVTKTTMAPKIEKAANAIKVFLTEKRQLNYKSVIKNDNVNYHDDFQHKQTHRKLHSIRSALNRVRPSNNNTSRNMMLLL